MLTDFLNDSIMLNVAKFFKNLLKNKREDRFTATNT